MNYTFSKITTSFFCFAFMLIGAFLVIASLLALTMPYPIFFPLIIFLIGFFLLYTSWKTYKKAFKLISDLQEKNYQWYKKTYPDNVNGNHINCFVCGNDRVSTKALKNRTFHREHFCMQCGKTLYYSREFD